MFAYPDAARYRLGVNYQQLPTNKAVAPVYTPTQRDGYMNFTDNYGDDPNYIGSMLRPMTFKKSVVASTAVSEAGRKHHKWVGEMANYFTTTPGPEDYEQATALWHVLGRETGHQDRLVTNLADNIAGVTNAALLAEVYALFSKVDATLAQRIQAGVEAKKAAAKAAANGAANGTNGSTIHIVREAFHYQ